MQVKMFSSVGWDLAEGVTTEQPYPTVYNTCTGDVITILRRNEFQHARATMSVVIRDYTGELHVYCKVILQFWQVFLNLKKRIIHYWSKFLNEDSCIFVSI